MHASQALCVRVVMYRAFPVAVAGALHLHGRPILEPFASDPDRPSVPPSRALAQPRNLHLVVGRGMQMNVLISFGS